MADTIRATHLADSLYNELLNGANFKELAKLHSEDDSSRATGGELESMTMDQLRPEFAAPLGNIDEGEISQPVKSQLGLHLLKLLEKSSSRSLSLDEDFDIIRNIALREKTAQIVEEWVEELKKKIYVDIREFSLKQ